MSHAAATSAAFCDGHLTSQQILAVCQSLLTVLTIRWAALRGLTIISGAVGNAQLLSTVVILNNKDSGNNVIITVQSSQL
eukprot:6034-Heterococcus_DN1.PRE.3